VQLTRRVSYCRARMTNPEKKERHIAVALFVKLW
jgi:hypothetical protein